MDASTDDSLLENLEEPLVGFSRFGELVTENIENDLLSLLVQRLISPGLSVLTIIVVAAVISSLAQRAIGRIVDRMKDPSAGPARRFRRRVGLPPFTDQGEEDLRREQRAESLGALARSVTKVVIWGMAIIMALGEVGVHLGPLIAGAGIVGVALGFGAQNLVRDFLSGVFMLIEDQFGVGDIVDAGEAIGVVEGISLRSTRIRDVDGTLWHVPNGEIRRVGNMSQDWARALLDVTVAYGTDIDAASDILERIAVEMAHEDAYEAMFLEDPEVWGIQDLGERGVDVRLVIKVIPGQQWAVMRELRGRIKKAFDEVGIEIPVPQRVLWMRTEQALAVGGEDGSPFQRPVVDDARRTAAVEASRSGGPGKVVAELDEPAADALRGNDRDAAVGESTPSASQT